MTTDARQQQILEFIRKAVHPSIDLNTQLLADGLLDSFDAVEVIDFLEATFSIRIDPAELGQQEMASVSTIAAFVERALQKAEGGASA